MLRSPAGYKFAGKDVWRTEVAGTLPTGATAVFVTLYEGRSATATPAVIAVRGWLKPNGSEYQRPLMFCSGGTNGGYLAAIEGYNEAGGAPAGVIPQYIYIYQMTDVGRSPGFSGATYKLQVDFTVS